MCKSFWKMIWWYLLELSMLLSICPRKQLFLQGRSLKIDVKRKNWNHLDVHPQKMVITIIKGMHHILYLTTLSFIYLDV